MWIQLKNVKAVQPLYRLNRTCLGKTDTFVLKFANRKKDILYVFQPFYQETDLEQEVNADLIYQTECELLDYAIYTRMMLWHSLRFGTSLESRMIEQWDE